MDVKLLPCPFCGADVAEIESAKESEDCRHFEKDGVCPVFEWDTECPTKRIVCNVLRGGCGASTGYAPSLEKTIEKWNRRAQ